MCWGDAVVGNHVRKMFEFEHPPSERRQRERFNHKDLLPLDFKVTMLPSTCNGVAKNKSYMPRGVQSEERIKL